MDKLDLSAYRSDELKAGLNMRKQAQELNRTTDPHTRSIMARALDVARDAYDKALPALLSALYGHDRPRRARADRVSASPR
jgi:hypothetical protein